MGQRWASMAEPALRAWYRLVSMIGQSIDPSWSFDSCITGWGAGLADRCPTDLGLGGAREGLEVERVHVGARQHLMDDRARDRRKATRALGQMEVDSPVKPSRREPVTSRSRPYHFHACLG